MKINLRKILRSFKAKILISFFAFIRIFIIWICIYLYINYKQTNLDHFTNHLSTLQNLYSDGNRSLQNFMLTGYHDSSFYTTGMQRDVTLFDANQELILKNLLQIEEEASANHIKISGELAALGSLHKRLIDTVKLLKELYLCKGFKDFGAEGKMRKYAHFLEDSCPINKTDILFLRRWEKDFMLRQEQKYIDTFNAVADRQIIKFSGSPATKSAMVNYKNYFNDFAGYALRISVNTSKGLYGHMQAIINQLDKQYDITNAKANKEVTDVNNIFKTVLVLTFVLLVLAAIYLSIVLSDNLTKDIKKLKESLRAFVSSGFKNEENSQGVPPSKISEVQELNEDFSYLKLALKQQIERSEDILYSFMQYTGDCHIIVGAQMDIIGFNKAAAEFIKVYSQREIVVGGHLQDYLENACIAKFKENFSLAFSGKYTQDIHTVSGDTSVAEVWTISFFPVTDREGNVFAISFNARKTE